MLTRPKQIVLDKSAFQGTGLDALREFARRHFLVLPHVLLDECLTSEKQAERLRSQYEQMILAGGYFCPSIWDIARAEAVSLKPCQMLADVNTSTQWRRGLEAGLRLSLPVDAEVIRREHLGVAERTLMQNRMVVDALFGEDFARICSEFKHASPHRADRLRIWCCEANRLNLAERVAAVIGLFGGHVTPQQVSAEWMTWHHVRLTAIVSLEYAFLAGSSPADKVEHDLQDVEYASLLCRADAIMTKDKRLVEPLARAAFPGKDVFSSLEDVPESYRCNWAKP
jgi:hypothetical protein